jgi:hypothetical protein
MRESINSSSRFGFSVVIGIVGFAVGLWVVLLGLGDVIESVESSWWPKAPGHVERSFVDSHSGQKGPTYHPEIIYSYVVKGATYNGHDIMVGRAWNAADAYRITQQFPPNSSHEVAYSSRDPNRSLLVSGLHIPSFSLFFLGCTIIGFSSTITAAVLLQNQGKVGSSGQISFQSGTPAASILWALLLVTFFSMLAAIGVLYL